MAMNDPTPTVETWTAFATALRQAGLRIFAESQVAPTDDDRSQLQFAGLTLMARTLSNLQAALLLLREKQICQEYMRLTEASQT
jgi:hypothetical protein